MVLTRTAGVIFSCAVLAIHVVVSPFEVIPKPLIIITRGLGLTKTGAHFLRGGMCTSVVRSNFLVVHSTPRVVQWSPARQSRLP